MVPTSAFLPGKTRTAATLLSAALLLGTSCSNTTFDAVSIRPIYGWVDGCTPVTVTGRGFGDDVEVYIGDQKLSGLTGAAEEIDKGFLVNGIVPPSLLGKGYQDVTVRTGGKEDVITGSGAYYYVECPALGYLESYGPAEGVAAGTSISLAGCGLDAAAIKVRLLDSTATPVGSDIAITSSCGTASASFVAPTVPADGEYYLTLVDADGNTLAGAPCPPPDTGDTAYACHDFKLIYGAAQ